MAARLSGASGASNRGAGGVAGGPGSSSYAQARASTVTPLIIFKGAATTVITAPIEEPFRRDYQKLLDQGTKPNLARLTLARKIAATALAMWKRQEVYDPARYRKQ